jgi:hypothetical protein
VYDMSMAGPSLSTRLSEAAHSLRHAALRREHQVRQWAEESQRLEVLLHLGADPASLALRRNQLASQAHAATREALWLRRQAEAAEAGTWLEPRDSTVGHLIGEFPGLINLRNDSFSAGRYQFADVDQADAEPG